MALKVSGLEGCRVLGFQGSRVAGFSFETVPFDLWCCRILHTEKISKATLFRV